MNLKVVLSEITGLRRGSQAHRYQLLTLKYKLELKCLGETLLSLVLLVLNKQCLTTFSLARPVVVQELCEPHLGLPHCWLVDDVVMLKSNFQISAGSKEKHLYPPHPLVVSDSRS